jgi:hypothetical protein
VHVKRPNTPAADYSIALEQYQTLVGGRAYTGDFFQIEGKNLQSFSNNLTSSILKKLENFKLALKGGAGAPAPSQASGAKPSSAEWPFPLLDLLSSAPSAQGQNTLDMSFSHGFCTEFDTEGNRVFVPHVFVRQGQLKSFNYVLQFLQTQLEDAGDPGSRDVQKIVKGMQTISMSLNLAEPIDPNMELSTFLQRLIGFPLKTQIFFITLADLAAMSQVDYDDWTKKVKACTETLTELIDNPNIWRKLHPTAKDSQNHAFINMNDLP